MTSNQSITITQVTYKELPLIHSLASTIWPVAYKHVITEGQINYMLGLMYNLETLQTQLIDGHIFLLLREHEVPVAFAAYNLIEASGTYKLQKLYTLPEKQGKGYGKRLVDYILNEIKIVHGKKLQLNVNRKNTTKHIYAHWGFKIIREEDIDIGSGYFMNDYIMEINV